MSMPRTTHPWLQPLYDALEGRGTRQPQLGSATGTVGLYGATGIARLATGTMAPPAGSITGASGLLWANGGSGSYYHQNDVVAALKNLGVLKP
jgi:hypothetical protein